MPGRVTGRQLNVRWRVGAAHALYREDGTWYHVLVRFPGALFDAHGYLLFESRAALLACQGMTLGEEKNWINFPSGIASQPGYVRVS
jgi:5-methylcytosine-specific restriction enzyme A